MLFKHSLAELSFRYSYRIRHLTWLFVKRISFDDSVDDPFDDSFDDSFNVSFDDRFDDPFDVSFVSILFGTSPIDDLLIPHAIMMIELN